MQRQESKESEIILESNASISRFSSCNPTMWVGTPWKFWILGAKFEKENP